MSNTAVKQQYDLTRGGISRKLLLVALPIIGSQFMQMTYNLVDMFWLGRLSSDAVAASGTPGFYLWFSMAFLILARMGAEIGVSQSMGRGDRDEARKYSQNALFIALVTGLVFGGILIVFPRPLIGFFNIREAHVAADAASYLSIAGIGIPMTFLTSAITGSFTASGNSRLPFFINASGLIANMLLDPFMIFTLGWGIDGAAVSTVIGQCIVCVLSFIAFFLHKERPFETFRLFVRPDKRIISQIFKWCIPISLESMLFTFLSMIIARFVAEWGSSAIAVQRIGSQIESLSWLLGAGIGSAFTVFAGQNFGAYNWSRIRTGFRITSFFASGWGLFITALMFFLGGTLYRIFVRETDVIYIGIRYMQVLALCQISGNLENVASGAFRGLGKTLPPTIVSIFFNALRIPLCYIFSRTSLGLDGIWIGLTIGAFLRGIGIYIWFLFFIRRVPQTDGTPLGETAPANQ